MKIYGAGIAGLLAGCTFQNAEIFEANDRTAANHSALLRFRSSAVGDAVGIEFRKVRVTKNIWSNGQTHTTPTIQHANNYSQKVVGRLAARSITNLDTVERFVAPEDFIPQLVDRCRQRIHWGYQITDDHVTAGHAMPVISTIPMSIMAQLVDEPDRPMFSFAPIAVQRFRIPDADVHQTIYFPDPDTTAYRVSVTGDVMIAEYAIAMDTYDVFRPFGLAAEDAVPVDTIVRQRYGKIVPVDEAWRQRFIFNLTQRHNIYSLGRFATWRNILLDDVLHDLDVLKRLMKSSAYDRLRATAK